MMKQMEQHKTCQMTVEWGRFSKDSAWRSYGKCDKPAKYIVPNPKMGVNFVCGIHARSLDKMFERTGQNIKCLPLK